eukprot:CAMPEP_0203915680 /NCGR_PEP_ID=MMETSP0359-20131031/56460_1 /ASSEMBLY_ACC=CAM_ASM_000338 /TAXON_ID=268821 /ORGANISM="Scrippsiella Hangoei, Strain SHTV-5" /LENGTH=100 /DNA_ID=CAMNT_0050842235 /DNA_START=152 /DNA_END=451 /DNA_ORIENTATION=-
MTKLVAGHEGAMLCKSSASSAEANTNTRGEAAFAVSHPTSATLGLHLENNAHNILVGLSSPCRDLEYEQTSQLKVHVVPIPTRCPVVAAAFSPFPTKETT